MSFCLVNLCQMKRPDFRVVARVRIATIWTGIQAGIEDPHSLHSPAHHQSCSTRLGGVAQICPSLCRFSTPQPHLVSFFRNPVG